MQRINRKLKKTGEELRASRSDKQAEELGNYFTVHTGTFGGPQKHTSKGVCLTFVKLDKLGRELGVLKPWEEVSEEE